MIEYDDFCSMNREREICKEIGLRLKTLRIRKGYTSYENFALEYDLSRMQYWRIEKGLTNLTMRSLITLLNIHEISLEEFFRNFMKEELKNGASGAKKKSSSSKGRARKK